jgi:hypothetical protein
MIFEAILLEMMVVEVPESRRQFFNLIENHFVFGIQSVRAVEEQMVSLATLEIRSLLP